MQLSPEQVIRRFVDEVLNGEDLSTLPELVDRDYVYRSPGEELRGWDGFTVLMDGYRAAFPDLKIEIDELLVSEDSALLSFTLTGTQRGAYLGHPATNRPVKVHGMVRSQLRDGKIVATWEILDRLSLFEQLGLVKSVV